MHAESDGLQRRRSVVRIRWGARGDSPFEFRRTAQGKRFAHSTSRARATPQLYSTARLLARKSSLESCGAAKRTARASVKAPTISLTSRIARVRAASRPVTPLRRSASVNSSRVLTSPSAKPRLQLLVARRLRR